VCSLIEAEFDMYLNDLTVHGYLLLFFALNYTKYTYFDTGVLVIIIYELP